MDDLGEGLDFSRSSKLSKIIFDYCEAHDIQLIVTSNDNFLMNAVNLDYWVENYAAIIVRNDNPDLSAIVVEFTTTISLLSTKP